MTEAVTRYDGQAINGKIKAWNTDKGFGFAAADDGGEDIFMHQSVIEVDDNKYRAICPGTKVEMIYFDRDGKHTASKVTGVEGASFKGFASKGDAHNACAKRPAGSTSGRVKWYNSEKGFGFILPDEEGKDIFFSIKDVENQMIFETDEPVVFFLQDIDGKTKATKVRSLNAPRGRALFAGGPHGHQGPQGHFGFPSPQQGPGPLYPQYPPQQQMYPPQGPYGHMDNGMGYGGPPAGGRVRTGTCKWYNESKSFGFIVPSEGGKDVYFREVSPPPAEGDPLEFEIKLVDGKPAAVNVIQTKNRKRKVMDPYQGQFPSAPQSKAQRPASYPQGPGASHGHGGPPHGYQGPSAPQPAYDPYGGASSAGGNYGPGAPYAQTPGPNNPYPVNPQQGNAYGYPPQNNMPNYY